MFSQFWRPKLNQEVGRATIPPKTVEEILFHYFLQLLGAVSTPLLVAPSLQALIGWLHYLLLFCIFSCVSYALVQNQGPLDTRMISPSYLSILFSPVKYNSQFPGDGHTFLDLLFSLFKIGLSYGSKISNIFLINNKTEFLIADSTKI